MIAKIIDGVLHTLGEGILTDIHKDLGYEDIPIENISTKEDGSYYKYYLPDLTPDNERILSENNENIITELEDSVNKYIENEANTLGYDSIVSACSYAGYPNAYQSEAKALGVFRSSCWDKYYTILTDIENGKRDTPTVEELVSELPDFVHPNNN